MGYHKNSFNKVVLTGNIGHEPELKKTDKDVSYLVIDRKVLCDTEASHSNKDKSLFISTNMLNFGVQKFSFATFRSITT